MKNRKFYFQSDIGGNWLMDHIEGKNAIQMLEEAMGQKVDGSFKFSYARETSWAYGEGDGFSCGRIATLEELYEEFGDMTIHYTGKMDGVNDAWKSLVREGA